MELAIIKNKPDFVDLLIENKIDLTGFLTEKRLLFLFFYRNKQMIQEKLTFSKQIVNVSDVLVVDFN